jgi:hypothetical protein
MERTLEPKTSPGPPEEGSLHYPGVQMMAWWGNQLAQGYRLATLAYLIPGLATLQHLRLLRAEVSALGGAMAAHQKWYRDNVRTLFQGKDPKKAPEDRRRQPSRIPGMSQEDLQDLRTAWDEFEQSKGDWSKAR